MVIINTSADEVRIQAVSPLSIRGSGATAGAAVIAASGAALDGFTSWANAAATGIVEAKSRIKISALMCCVTTNPLLARPSSEA
jgi:uncharacterized protein (UPF0264 family)